MPNKSASHLHTAAQHAGHRTDLSRNPWRRAVTKCGVFAGLAFDRYVSANSVDHHRCGNVALFTLLQCELCCKLCQLQVPTAAPMPPRASLASRAPDISRPRASCDRREGESASEAKAALLLCLEAEVFQGLEHPFFRGGHRLHSWCSTRRSSAAPLTALSPLSLLLLLKSGCLRRHLHPASSHSAAVCSQSCMGIALIFDRSLGPPSATQRWLFTHTLPERTESF